MKKITLVSFSSPPGSSPPGSSSYVAICSSSSDNDEGVLLANAAGAAAWEEEEEEEDTLMLGAEIAWSSLSEFEALFQTLDEATTRPVRMALNAISPATHENAGDGLEPEMMLCVISPAPSLQRQLSQVQNTPPVRGLTIEQMPNGGRMSLVKTYDRQQTLAVSVRQDVMGYVVQHFSSLPIPGLQFKLWLRLFSCEQDDETQPGRVVERWIEVMDADTLSMLEARYMMSMPGPLHLYFTQSVSSTHPL